MVNNGLWHFLYDYNSRATILYNLRLTHIMLLSSEGLVPVSATEVGAGVCIE